MGRSDSQSKRKIQRRAIKKIIICSAADESFFLSAAVRLRSASSHSLAAPPDKFVRRCFLVRVPLTRVVSSLRLLTTAPPVLRSRSVLSGKNAAVFSYINHAPQTDICTSTFLLYITTLYIAHYVPVQEIRVFLTVAMDRRRTFST